eukprot:SAG22_NODE_2616_length_2375_cov_1.863357_3_plen_95_part_00
MFRYDYVKAYPALAKQIDDMLPCGGGGGEGAAVNQVVAAIDWDEDVTAEERRVAAGGGRRRRGQACQVAEGPCCTAALGCRLARLRRTYCAPPL